MRPQKIIRLNYAVSSPDMYANISIFGNPSEVRITSGEKSFISVKETGVTIGASSPAKINIQGMSGSMIYGGLLQDLPFPMSTMPVTPATPFAKQVFKPPMKELIKAINDLNTIAMMLMG
jgi:hypothetical protein